MEIERDAALRLWELTDYRGENIYFHDLDKDGECPPTYDIQQDIIIIKATNLGEPVIRIIISDKLLRKLKY